MRSWRMLAAPLVAVAAITLLGLSACQKSDDTGTVPPSGVSEPPSSTSGMGAPAQPRSSNPSAP
jgi:hypothetical protein